MIQAVRSVSCPYIAPANGVNRVNRVNRVNVPGSSWSKRHWKSWKLSFIPVVRASMAPNDQAGQSDGSVPMAARKAAKITGLYIGLIGIALFVFPTTCFGILFDPAEIQPIWIRVFGSLCALLGWYYYGASRDSALNHLESESKIANDT